MMFGGLPGVRLGMAVLVGGGGQTYGEGVGRRTLWCAKSGEAVVLPPPPSVEYRKLEFSLTYVGTTLHLSSHSRSLGTC
jgi:hypothetical protein